MKKIIKRYLQKKGIPIPLISQLIYEANLMLLRMRNTFSIPYFLKVRGFKNKDELKVNLGCGSSFFKDWINVDSHKINGVDLRLDLRQGLPFADNSVRFIFSEHFIEHITYNEAYNLLVDCYSILMVGGVLRIATPDGEKFIKSYAANDHSFFAKYNDSMLRIEAINRIFSEGGFHKFIYDYESLSMLLHKVGFSFIIRSDFNSSKYHELNQDFDEDTRKDITLYVEATK